LGDNRRLFLLANIILMPKNNQLNQFTNLYEMQKTLRFELKPIANTKKMLEEDQVVEKDHLIKRKYEQTKPFFDRLHREFVAEALISNYQG